MGPIERIPAQNGITATQWCSLSSLGIVKTVLFALVYANCGPTATLFGSDRLGIEVTATIGRSTPSSRLETRTGSLRLEALIQQLGSKAFTEREAASKALEAEGERALDALRAAAIISHDLEIRVRARRLVTVIEKAVEEHLARSIKDSNLNPLEKGRKLGLLIRGGMSYIRVSELLGQPSITPGGLKHTYAYYPNYGLVIIFDSQSRVVKTSLASEED
jgi:hypothetical protein